MMNQADIFRKIGNILNELTEQYDFLARNPEQLNELELELFLANASFLSDHIDIIRRLNIAKPVKHLSEPAKDARQEEASQQSVEPPVTNAPVVDDLPEPKDYSFFEKPADLVEYVQEAGEEKVTDEEADNEEQAEARPGFEFDFSEPASGRFDFEEKPVTQIFDRQLSDEEQRIIAEKQHTLELQERNREINPAPSLVTDFIAEKIVHPAPAVSDSDSTTPSPLFSEDKIARKIVPDPAPATSDPAYKPTLNDLLATRAGNHSVSPAAPAQRHGEESQAKPPVSDLKAAITLNEKLLYIKDLFNGYNLAYSEAIDLINKMPDLKTADAFLKNNYAEKNNWAAKQGTVEQFYELLARRFPNG
ncbi:hypothetical protein [Pedobacter sp. JY14-1]|uniref:hypothetical protein n=1 Tax=Pedobacter sp. JY14-1 TaxID=3034151 RepID=UPI0023E1176B|nr:hypothetical protein [Pedobacter sp. JY14-1]